MNIANAITAMDLVSCFPRCLEPAPVALRFQPFVGIAKSNHDRFIEMVEPLLERKSESRAEEERDRAIPTDGPRAFRSFVDLVSASLSAADRDAHQSRLDLLETHYNLSYGAIVESIASVRSSLEYQLNLSRAMILEQCLRATFMDHGNDIPCEPIEVGLEELTRERLTELLDRTFKDADGIKSNGTGFLMLMSGARMSDGSRKFIPMLDFRLAPHSFHCDVIEALVRASDATPGVIVESGRSYHYYGFRLMNDQELLRFAHKALLMTPFVDARYLGHRLLGGELRLRVSGRGRTGSEPRVSRRLLN